MHVVGLDLSLTATGVALGRDETFVVSSKQRGTARLVELRDRVLELVGATWKWDRDGVEGRRRADLVVVEGYSFSSKNSHAHALGELGGVVRVALTEAGMKYAVAPPTVVKKYATGRGNAGKGEVLVAAVRRLFYEGSNDNEADSLWLREMGLAHLHPSAAIEIPATHRVALDKVEWPEGLTLAARGDALLEAIDLQTEAAS